MNRPLEVKNGNIEEEVDPYFYNHIDGDLEKVISRLQKEKTHYSKTHTDLRIDRVQEEYDDGYKYVLKGTRPATEEEKAAWKTHKDAETEHAKEWKRKQLAQLQKEVAEGKL